MHWKPTGHVRPTDPCLNHTGCNKYYRAFRRWLDGTVSTHASILLTCSGKAYYPEVDNVVVLPPENKSGVTDKKECEERTAMPSDVSGEVEVDYKAAESASDESDTKVTKHTKQVTAPWNKKKLDSKQCWRKVTIWWAYWQKTDDKAWWKFRRKETSCELFKLFYTNEMNKHLVYQSLEYARQQNNHALDVNIYWVATIHSLVSNFFYWSHNKDVTTRLFQMQWLRASLRQ